MDEQQLQKFSFLQFREKLAENKKKATAFVGLLVVAGLVLSSTFFFAGFTLAKVIQVVGFIAIGFLHLSFLHFAWAALTHREKGVYSILLALIIFITLFIFQVVTHHLHPLLIAACCGAFLLPFALSELWRFYQTGTETQASLWYFSKDMAVHQSTVFLNSLPLQVKVQLEGRVQHVISFRAPVKMKLGLVFYHMIQDQNKNGQVPVDFVDRNNKPYGWAFFTAPLVGPVKYLNPEESIVENGIKANATIVVRRVSDPALLESGVRQNQISKTVV